MQSDSKPFDPLTDDVPMPEMGAFDVAVLKDTLGQQAAENVLLRSQVVAQSQYAQQLQQQVAALRAKVAELTPKDGA